MNKDTVAIIRTRKEIEVDLQALHKVKQEYNNLPTDIPDWVRVRTIASLLHDFYTGLERVSTQVFTEIGEFIRWLKSVSGLP